MLYAKRNAKKDNIRIYLILLRDLIKQDSPKIRPIFTSLYADTKGIIDHSKSYYSIEDRDAIPIIAYLVNNHADYFRKVDPKDLKVEDFTQLKKYLEKAVEIV